MSRFYQLNSHVRHYAWGMRRHGQTIPYIADLLGVDAGNNYPWAELWIGAHPSLSSDIVMDDGSEKRLDEFIAEGGAAVLGEMPAGVSPEGLPFLLKVLSCERALSIQSHPDKANAEDLHAKKPKYYPDANHKPEVMIALTEFEALAGFRGIPEILQDLHGLTSLEPWRRVWEVATEVTLKVLSETLLNLHPAVVRKMLLDLRKELLARGEALDERGRLCLSLQDLNPCDRGILFAFLLNHIHMQPGESLFIPANEPHAYLCGTGIECMANSDNVIRAGLTPKTIDIRALLSTLTFRTWPIKLSPGRELSAEERVYDGLAQEFQVTVFSGEAAIRLSERRCVAGVMLVLDGEYEFDNGAGDVRRGGRGTTWFRPAELREGEIRSVGAGGRLVLAEVGK